ncbi:MAG: hypothetical protein CFH30_00481 [Alphaproteobacteria bacterium MarineAlpha8_Bin1]|nr:MAG: hypothetical protein CFH30_00481 [Alphaproteobacteria bacterium MarineAlpha8_Bin1]
MRNNLFSILCGLFFFLITFNFSTADEEDKLSSIQIIQSSELTIKTLLKKEDISNFRDYISNCRGILIFPNVYEGGLLFGAKGGNGLLLIRKSEDKFSGPFFFSIGGLSVGFQIGVKKGRVVMTIMTNRGLKSVLKERVKFGVDVDAAVISEGVGYSAESTVRLADIYSFSDNSGLFIGGSLEGSYLQPRDDLNFSIHNKNFTASEMIKSDLLSQETQNLVELIKKIKNNVQ